MTTANNDAVAYATRTDLPTGDFRLAFTAKASSGIVSHSNFSQLFEVEYGGGNYVQLYSNGGDATPELRRWRNEAGADAQVLASGSYIDVWIRYLLTRTGTSWTLSHAVEGAVAWTSITTWTSANAWSGLALLASVIDLGNYVMPGALIARCRLYTAAHSEASMLSDSLSATPTLGSLWAAWFDGASASLDGTDSSGNARHLTVSGTFIEDADDSIETSGSTTTLTVTGASSSAVVGTAATRLALGVTGVDASATAGAAFTRDVTSLVVTGPAANASPGGASLALRHVATGATDTATPGAAALNVRATASGASSNATPGAATLRYPRTVTGAAGSATAGSARLSVTLAAAGAGASGAAGVAAQRVTLVATGAAADALGGLVSAVADGALTIDGASADASTGAVTLALRAVATGAVSSAAAGSAALVTRLSATGAAASTTAGAATVRELIALVVTGAASAADGGTAGLALTVHATCAAALSAGGAVAVVGGSIEIRWETGDVLLRGSGIIARLTQPAADLTVGAPELTLQLGGGFASRVRSPQLTLELSA